MNKDRYTPAEREYYVKLSNGRVELIKRIVAEFFKTTPEALSTGSRKREITHIRFIAIWYCSEYVEGVALKGIGMFFGDRHHSTIIHDIEKGEDIKRTLSKAALQSMENKIVEALIKYNKNGKS